MHEYSVDMVAPGQVSLFASTVEKLTFFTGKPTVLPAVEPVPVYPVKIEGDDVYVAVNVEL